MEKQFQNIYTFLHKYKCVYDVEYLKKYPKPFENFINQWINELEDWDFARLSDLESYPSEDKVQDKNFKGFLKKVRELTQIEKCTLPEANLPQSFLRKLNIKKRHEVQTLKTFLNQYSNTETILDIGGGAGHLSCALLEGTTINSVCIDMNPELQKSGLKKIKRWHPEIENRIKFYKSFFQADTQITAEFVSGKTSIIGLHSCGPLSVSLIDYGIRNKIKETVSFGCCYHKIKHEYNLSQQAQKNNLELSNNALHLAGRSAAVVNEADLQKRMRIKQYRYALHYFLYDNFQLDFYSVGNSHQDDFKEEFSYYARKYHKGDELNLITDKILNDFYKDQETQNKIKRNFLADIIRMMFGRVIELYLLLDRALYIQEHGREVKVFEVFDRKLSPRNILIYMK